MPKISNHRPARKARRAKQSSCIYRVHNWSAYDRALKQRGSVTLWFAPEAVAAWNYQGPPQRGAQFVYSDVAIETALTLRLIYHLPLRQTEGFVESLLGLMGWALSVPDHSTLSRRQRDLSVQLPNRPTNEPIHVVVDSSGLKVYGEGEWKVRQHGGSIRRTGRKLHLGLNEARGEVVAQTLTENSVDDAAQVEPDVETLSGDGGYDKHKVFESLARSAAKRADRTDHRAAQRCQDSTARQHQSSPAAPGSDPARDPQERTQGLETTKWVSSALSGRDADVSV